MSSSNRFQNLSARVLNALDRDFSGWQDLVPVEKDAELNEESLIDLLKDRKRAEIYRAIADKRNAFLKEAYEGSDKSFAELTQEFASFSYEQTHRWLDMEEKLSSIKLEFRAKSKPIDVENMGKNLDLVAKKIGENISNSVGNLNNSMDNYLGSFFNADSNGVSRVGSSELKSFLRGKVNQFKEENKRVGERQTEFINNSVKGLIQKKFEDIRLGKLGSDALNRSDLFTDEEMKVVENLQRKVIIDAIKERRSSNVNTINEMSQKFMGVSGKEDILKKLEECPADIITEEVKNAVAEAIDQGCILKNSSNSQSTRKVRWVADAVCFTLDYAAMKISRWEDKEMSKFVERYEDPFYKFCNSGTYYTAHIFTFGICSGWTLGRNIRRAIDGEPVDWKGISNALSGISFMVGLFSVKKWKEMFEHVFFTGVGHTCQVVSDISGNNDISTFCSNALLIRSLMKKSPSLSTLGKFLIVDEVVDSLMDSFESKYD